MPLVYDNTRSARDGGGWIDRPDANAFGTTELPALRDAAAARLAKSQGRWRVADRVATAAAAVPFAMAAAPALSMLWSGAPAATASGGGIVGPMAASGPYGSLGAAGGWTAGAGTGATSGALSRLSSVFNSKGMDLGVNAGLNLIGMRSNNKANDQARLDAVAAQKQAIDVQLKQIADQQRSADLDREESKRLNDRAYALEQQRFALDKDTTAFTRGQVEQRDARLAPYRQISAAALQKLSALWGLN